MINFLFGTYGSGKTTELINQIAQDTANGIHTFLIVPEQETVQAERTMLEKLPPSSQLYLEVLNFSRLYNRVCREYGGLSYRYATKPILHLMMWQNLRELAPILEEYGNLAERDSALSELMLSAISECKACCVTPDDLERTAKQLPPSDPLGRRLRDLALIYASYDRLVSESYSDSSDDLSRLFEILQHEHFFKDTKVYIDSFSSFTAIEHRIIERIFAQASDVTVSIPLSRPETNEISTAGIRHSLDRLTRSADLHGGYTPILLHENKRAMSPCLAYISENLWRMDISDGQGKIFSDESITMEICSTPYAEAEACASHVLRLMRQGVRCRDILILMRSPENYRGILEPALDKAQIPYFFSDKTDLCTLPPVQLILSALRIKQFNWQQNDIISHLKTGMYPLDNRSIDLFEEYVTTWNIQGDRFLSDAWTMNPDGFTDSWTNRGKDILTQANKIRKALTELLTRYFVCLDACETVADLCRATYQYLTSIQLEKRLSALSKKEISKGNIKEAKELSSIWGIILNTLADVGTALENVPANTEEFALILRTVFKHTDIGTIPTSVDEVTIGSAAMLRAANPKYVLILGLCEGEFPAGSKDSRLFSDGERAILSDLGIELSGDGDIRSSDELMYVQRAFAAPSHGLFLFTHLADSDGKSKAPSLPFNRVKAMFHDYTPHRFEGSDLNYLCGSAKSAIAYVRNQKTDEEKRILLEALKDHIPHAEEMAQCRTSNPRCVVDPKNAPMLTEKELSFSSSRFEAYVSCPFQYYCTYVLGLRERKQASFRASNMGTFIHYLLEQLLRFAIEPNEDGQLPDDATLIRKTEETVNEYVERICPIELRQSRRLKHQYTRLKNLSLLMIKNIVTEFSHSKFRPVYFELPTDGKNENPTPMVFEQPNGCKVSFHGIIDRVDVYQHNGQVYIRVVDYKTGTKRFSLDDVEHGVNIQMLLYLFTLCRNPESEFCRSLGVGEGNAPLPAGVLYFSSNIPVLNAEQFEESEKIMDEAASSLKRSGLLLDDEEILLAMNDELSPKFLAGIRKVKKTNSLSGDALTSAEKFNELYGQIETTVNRITDEMRKGVAHAKPVRYKKSKNPCDYCKMKTICRKERT